MYNVMEVVLTPELSKLVVSYRKLKNTQEKQTILLIIFIMTLAFSTKLSFGLLFITLCIVAATLVYITISMQNSIATLQRNVFTLCYQQLRPEERQQPDGNRIIFNDHRILIPSYSCKSEFCRALLIVQSGYSHVP